MSNETCARRPSERRDADRAGLGRASTLRQDDTLNPFDVTIDDLSCGGCRLSGGASLAVGEEVSIGLPGVGASFIDGAITRDYTRVMGTVILYGGLIILFNLIADILYAILDPRVRYE